MALSKVHLEELFKNGLKELKTPPRIEWVPTMLDLLHRDLAILYTNICEWDFKHIDRYRFAVGHKTPINVFHLPAELDHIYKDKVMPYFSVEFDELGIPKIEREIAFQNPWEPGRVETYLRRMNSNAKIRVNHIPLKDINSFFIALNQSVWAGKLKNIYIEFLRDKDGTIMREFVLVTLIPKDDLENNIKYEPETHPTIGWVTNVPYFLWIKRTTGDFIHINADDIEYEINRLTMLFLFDIFKENVKFLFLDNHVYFNNEKRVRAVTSIINTLNENRGKVRFRMVVDKKKGDIVPYPEISIAEALMNGVCIDVGEVHTALTSTFAITLYDGSQYDLFELEPWGEHYIMTASQRSGG